MLDVIRRNAGSWLLKIILGAIVVVFVFWGIGSFRSQRMSVIAKVNGEDILQEQYQQAYAQAIERYSKMFGGSIPAGLLKQLNIKKQVLDSLIDDALVRQAASDVGIRVSEEEIRRVILSFPNFKRNGVFDKKLYDLALREAHLTPIAFEGLIRQQLITDKLREMLFSGIIVPDAEVAEYYRFQNEEINAEFVKIPSSSCEDDVNVTDQALKGWFEENKARYETKPKIKIRYVEFSRDEVLKGVTVTPDAIQSYYETHKKDYEVKERRRARHILIKVPPGADNATTAKKREKALEILKKAKAGEDFAELAKKYSEDPGTAKSGGDLGFFTKGMMVKPFEEKVFSMKEGEIAGPIRTQFGFHVVKLEKVEPSRVKSLEEVKEEIEKKLKDQKANDILWEMANKAYDEIIGLGGLDVYAKGANIELKETGLFSKDAPPPLVGFSQQVLNSLFALDKGELSSLLEVPKGIIIAEVVEKRPPEIPEFDTIKSQVRRDFVREKAQVVCEEKAKDLLAKAKSEGLEKAAKSMGLEVEETGFFKRSGLAKAKGVPRSVAKAALALYEDKPLCEEPMKVQDEFYVFAFKERKAVDMSGLDSQKDQIRQTLLNKKKSEAFSQWLNHQRQKAEIEILRNL
ncbi:Foldase protein PrsA precursor [Dissulfuribacter thermophilus]|uniref:Periplasmic chaperone PpiD n=1 Tax=Dissulfuribacter thermophilus TaxID=1156395 RepID=A0A1B9F8Z1_9BACT|nr:SurA N-terminal domain-containing protein [Dissulfuribacter thermophilus]OCC16376.1 Foldase protein PrsA precursor [Dissulfuribacter thermophilus]